MLRQRLGTAPHRGIRRGAWDPIGVHRAPQNHPGVTQSGTASDGQSRVPGRWVCDRGFSWAREVQPAKMPIFGLGWPVFLQIVLRGCQASLWCCARVDDAILLHAATRHGAATPLPTPGYGKLQKVLLARCQRNRGEPRDGVTNQQLWRLFRK